jgi:DNA-binding transcriptional regulator YhcF (GntR family)
MRKDMQYFQVINHLEAMIASGVLAPGAKLPSLRKLGEDFNLSIGTIRRSIDFLRKKGILTITPGSGAYVAERKRSSNTTHGKSGVKTRITVFTAKGNLSNSYCAHALHGVQSAVGENCSLVLNFHKFYNKENILKNSLLTEAAMESDALLFLGPYDYVVKALSVNKPCIGMEIHNSYNGLMSTISIDPFNAAELACNFFNKHHCKKVKALSHPMPVYRFRTAAFANLWRTFGAVEEVYASTPVGLDDVLDKETSYFFSSDTDYNRVARAYKEKYGTQLIDECCVLSIDGKSLLAPNFEPINTVAVDWKAMGVIALEECMRRIENPGTSSRRIYQNCYLKENQS